MYKILNPSEDVLKYPEYVKTKTTISGDKNAFSNLETALEHFNDLGQDITKKYHWAGVDIILHLYQNYLFDKYGVKCRLNTTKIKELNIKQNEGKDKFLRHGLFFDYGISLKLYTFKDVSEEAISEKHYKEYLKVLSESIVDCLLKNKNKILPFIVTLSGLNHANLIIFRTNTFSVEAFEPHGQNMGGQTNETVKNIKSRYNELVQYINAELSKRNQQKYTLFNVDENCPELYGIQSLEGMTILKKQRSEGSGYCMLWSLFIAEMSLINKKLTLREIINSILKHRDPNEISTFLHKVARGMTIYISEKIKKYYKTVFNYNMTIKEIVTKHRAIFKRGKYNKMNKLFKIYLLLEYELFETGKTPRELLEYYRRQPVPQKTSEDEKIFDAALSYQTEYKIYNAKLEILKNMTKNKAKITPVLNIDEEMSKNKVSKPKKSIIEPSPFIPPPPPTLGPRTTRIRKTRINKPKSDYTNVESYLLKLNQKKCRKGFIRSKKNKNLCLKKTIKNIPGKINSIDDPENNIPLNELIPRIPKSSKQQPIPTPIPTPKPQATPTPISTSNPKNSPEPIRKQRRRNMDIDIQLFKIKEKLRYILDSKSRTELDKTSFSEVYTELNKHHSKSELDHYYKKLADYYKRYIKHLMLRSPENKSKLPNRVDVKRTRKIIGMKPGRRKCPKTYRKYKKGYCFKYVTTNANTSTKQRPNIVINQTRKKLVKLPKGRKRCSPGFVLSSKPGYCENK